MAKSWTNLDTRRLRYLAVTTEMTDAQIAEALEFPLTTVRERARVNEIALTREAVVKTTSKTPLRDTPTQEIRSAREWLKREIEMGRMEIEAEFGRVDFDRIKQMQARG